MSHFTTTTPTMCVFLLFTPYVLHSHPQPHKLCSCDGLSNGVLNHSTNVICHPPLSNTIKPSLLPFLTTDTHHVGSVITANAKHPKTTTVKSIQQMHALKDNAEVHSVGCDWLAWRLHQRQWGIDTVPSNDL